jgi:hypothetical protein
MILCPRFAPGFWALTWAPPASSEQSLMFVTLTVARDLQFLNAAKTQIPRHNGPAIASFELRTAFHWISATRRSKAVKPPFR